MNDVEYYVMIVVLAIGVSVVCGFIITKILQWFGVLK